MSKIRFNRRHSANSLTGREGRDVPVNTQIPGIRGQTTQDVSELGVAEMAAAIQGFVGLHGNGDRIPSVDSLPAEVFDLLIDIASRLREAVELARNHRE